jgi:hypothetical protein
VLGLHSFCIAQPPDDGISVLKHVGVFIIARECIFFSVRELVHVIKGETSICEITSRWNKMRTKGARDVLICKLMANRRVRFEKVFVVVSRVFTLLCCDTFA